MSATSSFSGLNFPNGAADDTDEKQSWTDLFVSSLPSTGTFSYSAATGSLNSWDMVNGYGGQIQTSPQPGLSPSASDFEAMPIFPASNNGDGSPLDSMGAQVGGQMWSGTFRNDQLYTFSGDMQLGDGFGVAEDFDPSFGDPDAGENPFSLCLPWHG